VMLSESTGTTLPLFIQK